MPIRTVAVLAIGLAVLAGILYYASTVDARPPTVRAFSLTQHLSSDDHAALTTSSIQVDFSEPVEHAGAQAAFAITPATRGAFSWSAASMTFTPATRLPLRTTFAVSIGTGVRDRAGNRMVALPDPFAFTTVGNPEVVRSDPADGAHDVPLDAPIVLDFSTLMDTAAVEEATRVTPAIAMRLEWRRERLTIVPLVPLEPGASYTVAVGTGARDQAGTPLASGFRASFTAVSSRLSARTLVPAGGTAGVAETTPIAVVFDRALDPASLRDQMLTITPSLAGTLQVVALPGAAGMLDPTLRVVRFQPSAPLDPTTTYTVTLASGLLGADGSGLAAPITWTFTTGAPSENLSNQVVYLSDRAGVANLWAMNPDGSNQRQLSTELSPVVDYAVAPDSRSFVVGDGAVLIWQRSDGSARRQLTDAGAIEFDPAYAPDGSVITFGRGDPKVGTGLGLWTRDADGSDPRQVELPAPPGGQATASPPARVPLLRTPRFSPDGDALAFVDETGRVAIIDMTTDTVSTAPFVALGEPVWLPDSSGILVSGVAVAAAQATLQPPHAPVPQLSPALPPPAITQADIRTFRFDRGATALEATGLGAGAALPVVDDRGRVAFVRLGAGAPGSGQAVVSASYADPGIEVAADEAADVTSVAYAPEPGEIVVALPPSGPGFASLRSGIWVLDLASGSAQQLSRSGWLPRWLP